MPIFTCMGSLASTLGAKNPLRYRGYIYDDESGLYYLRARYYNPNWGRFVSADTVLGRTGGINTQNVFAYYLNDPVNYLDSEGQFAIAAIIAVASLVVAVAVMIPGSTPLPEENTTNNSEKRYTVDVRDASSQWGFITIEISELTWKDTGETEEYIHVGVGSPGIGATATIGEGYNVDGPEDYEGWFWDESIFCGLGGGRCGGVDKSREEVGAETAGFSIGAPSLAVRLDYYWLLDGDPFYEKWILALLE